MNSKNFCLFAFPERTLLAIWYSCWHTTLEFSNTNLQNKQGLSLVKLVFDSNVGIYLVNKNHFIRSVRQTKFDITRFFWCSAKREIRLISIWHYDDNDPVSQSPRVAEPKCLMRSHLGRVKIGFSGQERLDQFRTYSIWEGDLPGRFLLLPISPGTLYDMTNSNPATCLTQNCWKHS